MKKLLNLSFPFLLIAILMLQSGCFKDIINKTFPDVTAKADTIYGILEYKQTDIDGTKLVDWHFGPAVISATIGVNNVISSAPVEADGTFRLILPATISGTNFTSLDAIAIEQGGTIKVTPDSINFLGTTQFKVDFTDNGKPRNIAVRLATLNPNLTVYRNYFYNYYDKDGSFTGKSTSGNVFNWTFTKGWGMVESYITNTSTSTFNSKSIIAAPANAVWSN